MRRDDDDDEKWNVEKIEDIKYLFDSVFPPFDDAPSSSLPPGMSYVETMWFRCEVGYGS